MGHRSALVLTLAVAAVLLCATHAGAVKSGATTVGVTQSTDMTYDTSGSTLASGGIFYNIPSGNSEVYMWTVNPGVPYVVSWELEALLNTSNAPVVQEVSGANMSLGGGSFYFSAATNNDTHFFVASSSNVFVVDPLDLQKVAPNTSFNIQSSQITGTFILKNATSSYLFIYGVGTSTIGVVDLLTTTWSGQQAATLTPANPIAGDPDAALKITDDYGYVFYAANDYFTIARVDLNASSLDPVAAVVVNNLYFPTNSPVFYSEEEDILYMAVQTVDLSETVLLALNLSLVNPSVDSPVYNVTFDVNNATVPASASQRSVFSIGRRSYLGNYGDDFRALVISESPYQAVAMTYDYAGAQLFIMLQTGVIVRVNSKSFYLTSPNIVATSSIQNQGGLGMLVKDDLLLAWTWQTVVTSTIGTSCPSDCNTLTSQGTCVAGICNCSSGFFGVDCGGIDCTTNCSGIPAQGTCGTTGQCVCTANYSFSSGCTARQCPNDCNSNGVCSGAPDYTCSCDSLWAGSDCSLASYLACSTFTTQDECVAKTGSCGWCADTGKCVTGNLDGPEQGSCKAWYSGAQYQVGLLAAAIVVIVIFGLMIAVGVLSAMSMDYVVAGVLVDSSLVTTEFLKEAYWRDERSAKTWKMFDLFQFISFYMFIDVSFPAALVQFSTYFNWANMYLPMPYGYMDGNSSHPNRLPNAVPTSAAFVTGRSVLNLEQYANAVDIPTEHVFYATMFWFAMFALLVLALYGIYALFMYLLLRGKEPNIGTMLIQKVFYVMTRIVLIGYMPINFTAAWHISHGGEHMHKGSIAGAVFAIIIFGILPIAFNAFVVWNKGKELLFLYLKLRFGALYSSYHYEKARFNLLSLGKKFVIALLLGFLAAPSTAQNKYLYGQAFAILGVYAVYLIALIAVRPYLDAFHMAVDAISNIFYAVAFGIAVLHKNNPSTAGQIVAGICYVLVYLSCLLAFIHSWVMIHVSSPGRNTYPWILCGPKYGGLDADEEQAEELDTAEQIRREKSRKESAAGVMPTVKKTPAKPKEETSEEVDSSLQSSSEPSEAGEEQEASDKKSDSKNEDSEVQEGSGEDEEEEKEESGDEEEEEDDE